jgi:DNA-directed RNA polymerase subunit RPC12/RpoP
MAVLLSVQLSAKTSSKTKRIELNDTVVEFYWHGVDTIGVVWLGYHGTYCFNIYRWSPEYKLVFPKTEKQIRAFVEFIKEEYDCYYEDLIKSSGTECEDCCERVYVKTRKPIIAKKIKPWRKNFIMYGFIYE